MPGNIEDKIKVERVKQLWCMENSVVLSVFYHGT